jgi:hypothetical protein
LGGCWTKCGLHHEYHCECKEYFDASGQYIKDCPDDLIDKAKKIKLPQPSSVPLKQNTNIKCPAPTLMGASEC